IKRADPKRVQEMAYLIANGTGRSTMTRERESRARLDWRILALSSGERSLSEHAAISGNSAHAGAELRLVDVNAGTRPFRAFDDVHGMSGQQFHRCLSDAVMQHYGHL
ncbi:RNA helicase, partial [Pseudomonas aeruginosa]|nr:RNA helicase [Pseudomonas aeruginosa]